MKEEGKIKILFLIDNGGSSAVRCKIPGKYLNGKIISVEDKEYKIESSFIEVEQGKKHITEEIITPFDVLYVNWILENSPSEIDLLCKKNDCKYIFDIDDWTAGSHPYYTEQMSAIARQRCILQCAVSDLTVISTKYIADKLNSYTEYLHISPNALPIGEEQFTPKLSKNKKIGLGISGSVSHTTDWLQLKGILKKIASDIQIQNSCRFVINGVVLVDKRWQDVIKMFKTHKNMPIIINESLSVDEFMRSYDDLDILLSPLDNTEFNKAKSNLKITEAAIKDVILIGSPLYQERSPNAYIIANKPSDYYRIIKSLLKNDNLEYYSKKLSKQNRDDNDFEGRIEGLRKAIELMMNKKEYKPDNLKIYGITYSPEQYTEYESVMNASKVLAHRFEYSVMISKLEEIKHILENTWIGFFSHKFPYKTNLSSKIFYKLFDENVQDKELDLMIFTPQYWKDVKSFMTFTEEHHKGYVELFYKLCKHLNIVYKDSEKATVYSNFFIMKRDEWIDYIENWIIPSLEFMESDEEYFADASYAAGLSPDELEKFTGMRQYTFHTFILERLILQYIANKNLKTKAILS